MTAVNTADLQLQAGPHARIIPVTLPSNITVPNGQVSGLGVLAVQNTVAPGQLQSGTVSVAQFTAGLTGVEIVSVLPSSGNFQGRTVLLTTDNKLYRYTGSVFTTVVPTTDLTGQITTTQITNNAITTPLLNAGAVVTSKIATGAVTANELAANSVTAGAIVAGAIDGFVITGATVRTAASGSRVELSSNTLKATNSSGVSIVTIDNTGKAEFTGGAYDPFGGSAFGAAVGRAGTATNTTAICGLIGTTEKTGLGGGQGVKGHSVSSNPFGVGVYGLAEAASSVGVLAQNTGGGTALQVTGPMTISSGVLVTNLNADQLDSKDGGVFLNIAPCDVGTATAAGFGVNFTCTITGYQFSGASNVITLQPVSDKRLKVNIASETLGLDFINKLKPVSYGMLVDPTVTYHGLLADDVHELLSNENDALRTTAEHGIKGTDYISLIGPLILSVQQLSAKVDLLSKGKA